jgi:hypothetical protein
MPPCHHVANATDENATDENATDATKDRSATPCATGNAATVIHANQDLFEMTDILRNSSENVCDHYDI